MTRTFGRNFEILTETFHANWFCDLSSDNTTNNSQYYLFRITVTTKTGFVTYHGSGMVRWNFKCWVGGIGKRTYGFTYFSPKLNGMALLLKHFLDMMTSSNGNIFRVTGPLCGEFTGPGEFPTQRPVTRSFDVFFDLRLNKRLSKQPWGWWFETLSGSLWRQCNEQG